MKIKQLILSNTENLASLLQREEVKNADISKITITSLAEIEKPHNIVVSKIKLVWSENN
jgi:hypothetical protein